MPNGLWYASGDYDTDKAIPASAYSKGDILGYTSTSSWSRVDPTFAQDIAAIALAPSDKSIEDFNVAMIPHADTLFWMSVSTALGSDLTAGVESGFSFATDNNRYFLDASSTSVRAVVVRGTDVLDQSVQSHVLGKLIRHAGNLELS